MQEELLQFKMQKVWVLVDLPHGKRAIGTKWVFENKKDERIIVIRNKTRLVTQGHTQEKGIDYEEVFALLARIESIRLCLLYGFYGVSNESPRAWYETLANYLLENGFQRDKLDQTLFIKRQKDDILLVQIYVDDIIFGATNKDFCKSFEKLMKEKFQMSSMGELTFFLGLQVKQKKHGIFISQDKYVAEILRKFRLTEGKSASTPIDTEKPLLKDPDGEDVDVHTYSDSPLLGVNTPTSDEDRLELIELAVFLLPKVKKIINFLNGSSLKYALTVNPNIYVSCIKQFWVTIAVKKVNDVTRLQALVDKKKVVVTEATIREALCLDDAECVDCLPNEEFYAELARIGYEKPSTKITFYKAFFSSKLKFLIHTILQCMSAKRTSWNKFGSSMASAVICLSSGDLSTHTTKYTSPALTQKSDKEGDADEHVEEVNAGDAAYGDDSATHGEVPTVTEEPSMPSPTPPTPLPQPPQDLYLTSQV
nr:hypothetical protein [Tanacetum cinerariifolium]